MKPDRTNYEIWLIDYLDGNLDIERERDLLSFLDENADIREEFQDVLNCRIPPAEMKFRDKNLLKRTAEELPELQFELMCVASSENDLSAEQESELNELVVKYPEKRKIADQIKRVKLKPPPAEFKYKSRLKRLSLPQKLFRYSVIGMSAAASILIMITVSRKQPAALPENQAFSAITEVVREEIKVQQNTGTKVLKQLEPASIYTAKTAVNDVTTELQPLVSETLAVDSAHTDESARIIDISKIDYLADLTITNSFPGAALAEVRIEPVTVYPEEEMSRLNTFITKVFREKILKSESPAKGSLKGYEIADAGIIGLNKLLGWEMQLQKKVDENGVVNSVYFNSKLLKFNAPVKKSESLE